MRVTFVVAGGFSLAGGHRVIATTARGLSQRGHHVEIILAPRSKPTLRSRLSDLRRGRGWPLWAGRDPSHFDGLTVPVTLLERYRPVTNADVPDADVVVATWWEAAEWVAALSPTKGDKFYFVQGYEVYDWLPRERVRATYRLPLRKIVVSPWLVDLVRSDPDEAVSIVTPGVDGAQFHAPPRGKRPVPAVGILYSTAACKGIDVGIHAVQLARQTVPDLRLVAFGAERPCRGRRLPRRSTLLHQPPQDTLREIYARCDVWLCASWTEGFHLPPLEAMACRCPFVSTDVGGPRYIIASGVNGYLVPTGDADALARSLVEVLSLHDEAWQAMSEAAELTAKRYTWDGSVARFEAALMGRQ